MRSLLVALVLLSGCTAAQFHDAIKLGLDLGKVGCVIANAAAPSEEWLSYSCKMLGAVPRSDSADVETPRAFVVRVHRTLVPEFERKYLLRK